MPRKAILIESSNVKDQTDLPGARVDILNWKNFLKSELGGAWLDSELEILNKPFPSQVDNALKVATDCYCFVAFSGHGSNGSVLLNEYYHNHPISALKPKSDRGTLIVDACRGVADPVALFANVKVAMLSASLTKSVAVEALQGRSTEFCSAMGTSRILNRIQRAASNRSRWDTALNASLLGVVEMLACAKGQAAGEDPSAGGYYTSLLMQSAELWDQRTIQPATHSTKDAHDYAAAKLPSQQTPEYSPSWIDFPFAVST